MTTNIKLNDVPNITNILQDLNDESIKIYKMAFIIISFIFYGLLRRTNKTNTPTKTDLSLSGIDNLIKLSAGNIHVSEECKGDNINKVKYWMIYIVIIFMIILLVKNIKTTFQNNNIKKRLFDVDRLNESMRIAFMLSIAVLLTSSLKGEVNYTMATITFMFIYLKMYLTKGMTTFDKKNIFHYLVIFVLIAPLISNILYSINYTSSKDNVPNYLFLLMTNVAIGLISISSLEVKNIDIFGPINMLFKISIFTHIYNIVHNSDSSIF
jgi:hypothetical protein